MSDPANTAASDAATNAGRETTAFQNLAFPAIQKVIAQYMADLGKPGSEPDSVKKMFSQARDSLGSQFNAAELSSTNAIATRAKSMGLDYRPDATLAAQNTAMTGLEQQRAAALQNLSYQEGQAGMNQTNALLARMGSIERSLAGAAYGQGQAGISELGMMSQSNPWGGALSGAIGGAGSMIGTGNPYAIAGGAIVGGIGGYFSGGG